MIDHTPHPTPERTTAAPTIEQRAATPSSSRRGFLKAAGAVAATAAAASVGCAPSADSDPATRQGSTAAGATRAEGRSVTFNRPVLDALGEVMLPASLGAAGQGAAVDAFIAWIEGYDPVAEEMHGYGYADVRYLPPDPAPNWQAQLEGLDLLARKMRQQPFPALDPSARQAVVTAALSSVTGSSLPNPLGASHVAVALVAHWTSTPAASDLAYGARVGAGTCRSLDGVMSRPLPIVGSTTSASEVPGRSSIGVTA